MAALEQSLDATTVALRSASLAPRKSDILVGSVALVWLPQHLDA